MSRYKAITAELYDRPHVILPGKLDEIAHFVHARQVGADIEFEPPPPPKPMLLSDTGAVHDTAPANSRLVAVMPLFGVMFQHGGIEMAASGGTSTEQFGRQLRALAANESVQTIVIEVHSPGGQVFGTGELADELFAMRGQKRVVAAVNSMAASAAVWVATAADEVVITPGGEIGSIGVVVMHQDISGAEEQAGIRTTLIAVPDRKIAGHPFAPLDDETRDELREDIEATYDRFVSAVARHRGVSARRVIEDFGGGGMMRADQAAEAGLVDAVMPLSHVVAREVRHLRASAGGRANRNRVALAELDI